MIAAALSGNTFKSREGMLYGPSEIWWLFGQIGSGFSEFACGSVFASFLQSGIRTLGVSEAVNSFLLKICPRIGCAEFSL